MLWAAGLVLTGAQTTGLVLLLLRRSDMCLLDTGWQVRPNRRPGRPDIDLVGCRLCVGGEVSGSSILGIIAGF